VGILLEAKAKGAVDSVRVHLDALRQEAGFYVDAPLYLHALLVANESGG
jgi:predicted nucleic acid-binding protein